MSKVAIDAEVVIQEQQAEIDFLRNRVMLQGQAIKNLQAELAEANAMLPTDQEAPQHG